MQTLLQGNSSYTHNYTIKNINVSKHNQEHTCQQTQSRACMSANTIKNIHVSKHNQEHTCQQTQSRTCMSANTIKNINVGKHNQ